MGGVTLFTILILGLTSPLQAGISSQEGDGVLGGGLFKTREKHRVYFKADPASTRPDTKTREPLFNEQTVSMDTAIHELENDKTIAEFQYEASKAWAAESIKLFAQSENLYKKGMISKLAYEEDRARSERSQARAEEHKYRLEENRVELLLGQMSKKHLFGDDIPLISVTETISELWAARAGRAKAAAKFAQCEREALALALDIAERLHAKGVNSVEDLIKARRAEREARLVFELAQSLEKQNNANYTEAIENVKKAQAAL